MELLNVVDVVDVMSVTFSSISCGTRRLRELTAERSERLRAGFVCWAPAEWTVSAVALLPKSKSRETMAERRTSGAGGGCCQESRVDRACPSLAAPLARRRWICTRRRRGGLGPPHPLADRSGPRGDGHDALYHWSFLEALLDGVCGSAHAGRAWMQAGGKSLCICNVVLDDAMLEVVAHAEPNAYGVRDPTLVTDPRRRAPRNRTGASPHITQAKIDRRRCRRCSPDHDKAIASKGLRLKNEKLEVWTSDREEPYDLAKCRSLREPTWCSWGGLLNHEHAGPSEHRADRVNLQRADREQAHREELLSG